MFLLPSDPGASRPGASTDLWEPWFPLCKEGYQPLPTDPWKAVRSQDLQPVLLKALGE